MNAPHPMAASEKWSTLRTVGAGSTCACSFPRDTAPEALHAQRCISPGVGETGQGKELGWDKPDMLKSGGATRLEREMGLKGREQQGHGGEGKGG